jgi:ABC-2 type transport system ATP-binding protein
MISVEHLTKTYRIARKAHGLGASIKGLFYRQYEEVQAVQDISFAIEPGERVGFLGPNGAGKTTTLKMLAGLLAPTAGKISVLGLSPANRPRVLLNQITLVMGQKQQLIWDLPPIETLELNRAVYEIERAQFDRTLKELTEMLGLQGLLDKPTRQLSLGERMKCELAAALVHSPRVLFLDEPTIGLDVTMQAVVRRFIQTYNEQTRATIILTSHYMDDVAALCPRVIIIDHGRMKYDGDLIALMRSTNPDKRILVTLSRPLLEQELAHLALNGSPLRIASRTDGELSILSKPEHVTDTVRALLEKIPVADLRVEDPPLEDIMRQVFGS